MCKVFRRNQSGQLSGVRDDTAIVSGVVQVTGSHDRTIKLWDLRHKICEFICICMYFVHKVGS